MHALSRHSRPSSQCSSTVHGSTSTHRRLSVSHQALVGSPHLLCILRCRRRLLKFGHRDNLHVPYISGSVQTPSSQTCRPSHSQGMTVESTIGLTSASAMPASAIVDIMSWSADIISVDGTGGLSSRKSLYRSLQAVARSDILKINFKNYIVVVPRIRGGCLRDSSNRMSPMDRWHWAAHCIGHTHMATCAVPAEATCILGAVVVPNVIVSINGG